VAWRSRRDECGIQRPHRDLLFAIRANASSDVISSDKLAAVGGASIHTPPLRLSSCICSGPTGLTGSLAWFGKGSPVDVNAKHTGPEGVWTFDAHRELLARANFN
jgi:hypothetical protein